MKKIWILFIILIIVIIISLILVLIKRKKIEITKDSIKYMHFSYSTGNMMYSNVSYDIDYEDNKYIVTIKPSGISNEDAKIIEIDENIMQKVADILNKYDVYYWDKFHKSDRNILDGNSFSFNLKTKDNKTIDASGYMKWPTNYRNVREELNSLFQDLYNGNNISMNDFKYFRFSYSKGYAINSNIIYEINEIDGKYIASIKPYGVADEDKKEVEIMQDTLDQIENILNKYDVVNWNGFHESDKGVLDGDSFSFSLKTKENQINASGYMSWPTNYRNVRDEIDVIFDELYNK